MPDRGAHRGGHILVVDDNVLNRKMLARAVEKQGHRVTTAEDGVQALQLLRSEDAGPFDVILLDILMPEMDGYQVLERVKGDGDLRHIPVIMISALDEMDSVLRCIESGATDYLPKPFDRRLLQARLNASMAEKRLRDLELEYLEQVGQVVGAAQAVEAARFDPASLDGVAARDDALGQLARVFQRMAREVHLREQRLKQQLQQLRLDMAEMRAAPSEPLSAYLPVDRRQALAHGRDLPRCARGAALFADISGFTPLTEALAEELGLERGAEELTRAINQVYGTLIAEVHRYGGSVIGFSGDAITCWFDDEPGVGPELVATPPEVPAQLALPELGGAEGGASDGRSAGLRGAACALAMQDAMIAFSSVTTPTGTPFSLAIKVALVAGPVRRFLVGDPQLHVMEAIAGRTLDRLASAEHLANPGEIVADAAIVEQAAGQIIVSGGRTQPDSGERFALIAGLTKAVRPAPWPDLPPDALTDVQCRPWLAPVVYDRLQGGGELFLSELRTVTALFLRFQGIDYDGDEDAGDKLNAFVRWVQSVLERHEGSLFQLTMGDKGSYLCLAFGTPIAHNDDEVRAVYAALELQAPPPELAYITRLQAGVAQGLMRTGAYGSTTRHIYSIQGDKANLAARLMVEASGGILCDEAVYQAARGQVGFDPVPPMDFKGKAKPLPVFRVLPTSAQAAISSHIDRLSPNEQLTLKVASVIGPEFSLAMLESIFPVDSEVPRIGSTLQRLAELGLIATGTPTAAGHQPGEGSGSPPGPAYHFASAALHEAIYSSLLYTQRRHLHRLAAEWVERNYAGELDPHAEMLAHHWRSADEAAQAVEYLERAAQRARSLGDLDRAERLLRESLELDAQSAVLSPDYVEDSAPAPDLARLGEPDYEGAVRYALDRLERELPPELAYHNLSHTRDDVMPMTLRLAGSCGLNDQEMRLLEVGAAFHDIGFCVQRHDHERAGAEIAGQVLPAFGFDKEQVATVQGMIMATKLPQSPQNLLEEILADADLDNLGREDAVTRSLALRDELSAMGAPVTEEQWYERQLRFLRDHRYWTDAARDLRSDGKQAVIAVIEGLLADSRRRPP